MLSSARCILIIDMLKCDKIYGLVPKKYGSISLVGMVSLYVKRMSGMCLELKKCWLLILLYLLLLLVLLLFFREREIECMMGSGWGKRRVRENSK